MYAWMDPGFWIRGNQFFNNKKKETSQKQFAFLSFTWDTNLLKYSALESSWWWSFTANTILDSWFCLVREIGNKTYEFWLWLLFCFSFLSCQWLISVCCVFIVFIVLVICVYLFFSGNFFQVVVQWCYDFDFFVFMDARFCQKRKC